MTRSDHLLRGALAVAALLLPPAHQQRWQEEALAVLLDVPGRRRWRYAADTLLKLPWLAWQRWWAARRASGSPDRPVWAAVAGLGILACPATMGLALVSAGVIGEDSAEFFVLVACCGLAPAVALRAFDRAARAGGGFLRLAGAALVTVYAGTGPIATGLTVTTVGTLATGGRPGQLPMFLFTLAPGLWLLHTGATGLLHRRGPTGLAALGVLAGVGLLALAWPPGFVLFLPAFFCWTAWAGTRLIVASSDVLLPARGA